MYEKLSQPNVEKVDVGSYIEAKFDDGEILKIYLVDERDPDYDDADYDQVSINAPIGKAVKGHYTGDVVTCKMPSGANVDLEIVSVRNK